MRVIPLLILLALPFGFCAFWSAKDIPPYAKETLSKKGYLWAIEDGAVPSDIVYREVGGKYVKFYVYKPTDEAFKECLFSDICVPIIIKNPNSYDLEDYQVVINLEDIGLAGKYVRVIYYDISTDKFEFVNFCYEQSNGECNETVSSVIWVKVPSIPANGNTVIYIYPSDTNYAKNGDEVFDFYDDFQTLDSGKWNAYNVQISNGELITSSADSTASYVESTQSFNIENKILEVRAKLLDTTTTTYESGIHVMYDPDNRINIWSEGENVGYNKIVESVNGNT